MLRWVKGSRKHVATRQTVSPDVVAETQLGQW